MNNTKAKVSFVVEKADWMPENVKKVFRLRNKNRISGKDEFNIDCQDTVSPIENLKGAIEKIQDMVDAAQTSIANRQHYEDTHLDHMEWVIQKKKDQGREKEIEKRAAGIKKTKDLSRERSKMKDKRNWE